VTKRFGMMKGTTTAAMMRRLTIRVLVITSRAAVMTAERNLG